MLEAHESLPADLSSPSDTRYLKRVHAEHHTSFVTSTSRTVFSLDIPSDASPAFQVSLDPSSNSSPSSKKGGLEWKVRLCLLVAVAKEDTWVGKEGFRVKGLVREGPRGEWGSSWVPTRNAGGLQRMLPPPGPGKEAGEAAGGKPQGHARSKTWGEFFSNAFLGPTENAYHDGDDADLDSESNEDGDESFDSDEEERRAGRGKEVDLGGGKDVLWSEIGVEMVECEVPVKVWPGNTAFRAMDVVFDV